MRKEEGMRDGEKEEGEGKRVEEGDLLLACVLVGWLVVDHRLIE